MGSAVDNLSFTHDHDLVSKFECRHAVSNQNRSSALDEFGQCFMDQLFTFRIDLAGRFVKY